MKRNFGQWFTTMQDSIASWNYYINFEKVYVNVDKIKVELNILNSLVGSKNIETEFKELLKNYPNILPIIPLLLARREQELKIFEVEKTWHFNFKNSNYSIDDYATFMHKTGLFDLLQNHIISNLVDYMTGIEVGMDTNSRKNRTGKTMESLIEQYLIKYGLVQNVSYFKQMTTKQIKKKFNINIVSKSTKKFDFVIYLNQHVYACECNFYHTSGSKPIETARSYKNIAIETKDIKDFTFVWFTDGLGWKNAKKILEETFDVLENIYNLKDLEDGTLNILLKK